MKKAYLKLATTLLLSLSFCGVFSQNLLGPIPQQQNGVLDGVYVQENIPTKKVIQYTHLREADAIWSRRVWRVIDLRQKINQPLFYPVEPLDDRWSLWSIIRFYIENEPGTLTAYFLYDIEGDFNKKDGDQFKYPLTWDPALGPDGDSTYITNLEFLLYELGPEPTDPIQTAPDQFGQTYDSTDVNGNPVYPPREKYPITSKDIVEYHVKEDWFFDKQRSVMDVRIIGICPVKYMKELNASTGEEKIIGKQEMFWLYFPQMRHILQNYFVYNRQNDSRRMSMDDLFWKRMFDSYIYKSTNIYDRRINSYEVGLDALLESDRLQKKMFEIEHDVWHF